MKEKHFRNLIFLGTILGMAVLSVGCRVVFWTSAAAVGAVGLVGYSVYKGGESVVTGVGNLGSSDAKDTATNVNTVVISGKIFKTECDGSVEEVWLAAGRAFRRANFQKIAGNYDLLSGQLTALTWDGTPVTLDLQNTGQNRTTLRIWTGTQGDLSASQSIYNLIQEEMSKRATAAPAAAPKDVTP